MRILVQSVMSTTSKEILVFQKLGFALFVCQEAFVRLLLLGSGIEKTRN